MSLTSRQKTKNKKRVWPAKNKNNNNNNKKLVQLAKKNEQTSKQKKI